MTLGPEGFGNPWMARLSELGPPEPVGWWPPAPGWVVVACLLLAGVLGLLWRGFRRWQALAYRRQALGRLTAIEGLTGGSASRSASLAELPILLKQTALAAYPRVEVASLSGKDWMTFLDRTSGTSEFTYGSGEVVQKLAYDHQAADSLSEREVHELFAVIRRWIKKLPGEETSNVGSPTRC